LFNCVSSKPGAGQVAGEEVGEHITRRPFDVVAGSRVGHMARQPAGDLAREPLYEHVDDLEISCPRHPQ